MHVYVPVYGYGELLYARNIIRSLLTKIQEQFIQAIRKCLINMVWTIIFGEATAGQNLTARDNR